MVNFVHCVAAPEDLKGTRGPFMLSRQGQILNAQQKATPAGRVDRLRRHVMWRQKKKKIYDLCIVYPLFIFYK